MAYLTVEVGDLCYTLVISELKENFDVEREKESQENGFCQSKGFYILKSGKEHGGLGAR